MMSLNDMILHIFVFFQAEDGIRDIGVTGVQTCALPIYGLEPLLAVAPEAVSQHPLPERLDPEMDAVPLSQLLASEGWTEVGVVGLDQPQRLRSERRRIAAVCAIGRANGCNPLTTLISLPA